MVPRDLVRLGKRSGRSALTSGRHLANSPWENLLSNGGDFNRAGGRHAAARTVRRAYGWRSRTPVHGVVAERGSCSAGAQEATRGGVL
jgi:hypothetical protein